MLFSRQRKKFQLFVSKIGNCINNFNWFKENANYLPNSTNINDSPSCRLRKINGTFRKWISVLLICSAIFGVAQLYSFCQTIFVVKTIEKSNAVVHPAYQQWISNFLATKTAISENVIEQSVNNIPTPTGWGWCVALRKKSIKYIGTRVTPISPLSPFLITAAHEPRSLNLTHYFYQSQFYFYLNSSSRPPLHPTITNPLFVAQLSFTVNKNNHEVICDHCASYDSTVLSWIAVGEIVELIPIK